jgi:para-nitrobenzyl esterase
MPTDGRLRRREFLGLAVAVPALIRPGCAATARFTAVSPPYVTVETALGRVRGGHSRGALAFKGVPYAGPVSGAGRFKPAPPALPWRGVRDALRLGPSSMQGPGTTYGEDEPPCSEDCLVLNVWTPAVGDGRKRPVMFYCHGGGYASGSGGSIRQDGSRLAAAYDVVVVGVNHRLGLLGYLYLGDLGGEEFAASGNQGMLDIIEALRWVRTNIEAFGGDPGRVMIFGESGGAHKVGTLLAMPAAHGLFQRASIESGAALRRMSRQAAAETTRRVLAALDISPARLGRLAEVPASTFVSLQLAAEKGEGPLTVPADRSQPPAARSPLLHWGSWYSGQPGSYGPVVDGAVLPCHPFDPSAPAISAGIPLLIGCNRDEAAFFYMNDTKTFEMNEDALAARLQKELGANAERVMSLYRRTRPNENPVDRYIAITTAIWFGAETAILADRKSRQPAPVYRYRYDFQSNFVIPNTQRRFGAGHASEIAMKFFNYDMPGLHGNGPGTAEVSRTMSALWTSFAETGKPSAAGAPSWTPYDPVRRATMLIGPRCLIADDPGAEERRLWESIGPL